MGPNFDQGGQGGFDRDLFGSRDPNQMGQGGGIGRDQSSIPGQGEIPTSVQPPVGQGSGLGQGEMPGQSLLPEDQDQIAQEQGMNQPGQMQPPIRQPPVSPEPGQFLGPRQGEIPTPPQPPITQLPEEIGQEERVARQGQPGGARQNQLPPQPSRQPVPTQRQPPIRQTPDLRGMEPNAGNGRGQLGSQGRGGVPPIPQQPPMGRNPNQIGQGGQTPLGGREQNELIPARPPTVNPNPSQVGRPQSPPPTMVPGQTESSQRRGEFGDEDIDELRERISRPPRGK